MVACRLTLLGGFALELGSGEELTLPTRKDRLLLAYLALSAGKPQARDRLAGLLWGDRAETQARDSLKQALAGIRQAFRQAGLDPVRADRESVTFALDGIEVDAVEFARLATEARRLRSGRRPLPWRPPRRHRWGDCRVRGMAASRARTPRRSRRARARAARARIRAERRLPTRRSGSAASCSPATACASRSIAPSCASMRARASARRR